MVKFIKNPDRTRNLKILHVRLFDSETEETSIVTASEDREEVSDPSMTSRLLDQSEISNPFSDTFMKEVQLIAAAG